MDLAVHQDNVLLSLLALERGLSNLVTAIAHGDVSCVLENQTQHAIRTACEAYAAIEYRMEDKANASVVCPGAIGVGADILEKARVVNELKAEFKMICTRLSRVSVWVPVKNEDSPTRTIPAIRAVLRHIGRSDVNLLAAYRQIPVLKAPPTLISFTRANTRAVYRKTIDEIYTMLLTSEHPKASDDRARLDTLDRHEDHLALVKEHYRNIRANVYYARLDPRGRGKVQIAGELPILYPKDRFDPPEIRFPQGVDLSNGPKVTRQSKLDEHPFLESLNVFRYRETVSRVTHLSTRSSGR